MKEIKSKLAKLAPLFQSAMVVLIASLFVMSIVYAATTIGSNITTAGDTRSASLNATTTNIGTLRVYGTVTSTSATTTNYMMIGGSVGNVPGFNYEQDLSVAEDVYIGGIATTTTALWIGGNAANKVNLNFSGGDLFVAGDVQIEGRVTSTSATTTNYVMIGGSVGDIPGFNYEQDLSVAEDVYIGGIATTTTALWVGTGVADHLNQSGGDLYVQGNAEFDSLVYFSTVTSTSATSSLYLMVGDGFTVPAGFNYNEDLAVSGDIVANGNATTSGNLSVGGFASTTGYLKVGGGVIDLSTTTPTTTKGIFSRDNTTATSTISIGNQTGTGCLEIVATGGIYYSCYIDPTASSATALVCYPQRCKD